MILTKILAAADHPYLMGKGGRMVILMIVIIIVIILDMIIIVIILIMSIMVIILILTMIIILIMLVIMIIITDPCSQTTIWGWCKACPSSPSSTTSRSSPSPSSWVLVLPSSRPTSEGVWCVVVDYEADYEAGPKLKGGNEYIVAEMVLLGVVGDLCSLCHHLTSKPKPSCKDNCGNILFRLVSKTTL